jgi:hypothetical protein
MKARRLPSSSEILPATVVAASNPERSGQGKWQVGSRRGTKTQWCRRESDGELTATSTFTVPAGDLPSTGRLSGEGNGAAPWGKGSAGEREWRGGK